MDGLGEDLQRIGNAASSNYADADAENDSENRQQACRVLHLVHAAVSFVARLLHDYGPVQRGDWAVGAQHDYGFSARPASELACRRKLSLAALLDEVADDFQVTHVLPGCIRGVSAGNQPALAVYDIGHKTAAVN